MIDSPMDVLRLFPVRKSTKQKSAFRDAVIGYARRLGYEPTTENGAFGSRNVVIGNPETANYLVTAHYDTCVGLPFPNFITPNNFLFYLIYQVLITAALLVAMFVMAMVASAMVMLATHNDTLTMVASFVAAYGCLFLFLFGPANKHNANDNTSGVVTLLTIAARIPEIQRSKVCFVLFDLEEAGLIGSASYAKRHNKVIRSQTVLNLDCVGDGDELVLYPSGKLKKDPRKMAALDKFSGTFGAKNLCIRRKGFGFYPSDQMNFPFGAGVCALRKSRLGLYLGRIHTARDTILDETNVNILCAAITSVVCCDTVNQKGNAT